MVKDKERLLKAEKEKKLVTYKWVPMRMSAGFSTERPGQKGLAWNIQSDKKQGPTTKLLFMASLSMKIEDKIKSF